MSSSSVYSPSSLSPMRSEEFDHQQSSITLLKAQLKLVTQERDLLKKDMKRISQDSAANRSFGKVVQSQRRTLLGPSPG